MPYDWKEKHAEKRTKKGDLGIPVKWGLKLKSTLHASIPITCFEHIEMTNKSWHTWTSLNMAHKWL